MRIPTLADKLTGYGIFDVLVTWIVSMLGSRQCQMKFGSWRSDLSEVCSGLPQGSRLSCLLFNVYRADMNGSLEIEGTDPFSPADDVIVCYESDSPVRATEKLSEANDKFEQWTTANHMRFKPDNVFWMYM